MEDKHIDINLFIDRIIEKDLPLKYAELLISVADDPVFPFGIIQGATKIKSIQKSKFFTYNSLFNSGQEIPLNFEIHNSSFLYGGSVDIRDCYIRAIHSDSIEMFEGKTQLLSQTGRPGPYVFFKGSISISNSPWRFSTDSSRSSTPTPHKSSPTSNNRNSSYSSTKPFNQPTKYNQKSARGSTYYQRSSSSLNATTSVPTPASGTSFATNMTKEIQGLAATAQHILNKQNQISKPNERLFPDTNYNISYTTQRDSNYAPAQTKKSSSTGYKHIKIKDNIPRCARPENNYKIPPKKEEPPPPKRKTKAKPKAKTQSYATSFNNPPQTETSNPSQAQTIAPSNNDKPHVVIDTNSNLNTQNTTTPATEKVDNNQAATAPISKPTETVTPEQKATTAKPEVNESKTEEPPKNTEEMKDETEEKKDENDEKKDETEEKKQETEEKKNEKDEKKDENEEKKQETEEKKNEKDEKKDENEEKPKSQDEESKKDKQKKDDDTNSILSISDSDIEEATKLENEKKDDKPKQNAPLSGLIGDVISKLAGTESKKEKPAPEKEEKPATDLSISGISLTDSIKKLIEDDDKPKDDTKTAKEEDKKKNDDAKEEDKKKKDDILSDVSGLSDILDDKPDEKSKEDKKPEKKTDIDKKSVDSEEDDFF